MQAMVRRGETEVKHRIYTALDGELFKHDGDTDGDIQVGGKLLNFISGFCVAHSTLFSCN